MQGAWPAAHKYVSINTGGQQAERSSPRPSTTRTYSEGPPCLRLHPRRPRSSPRAVEGAAGGLPQHVRPARLCGCAARGQAHSPGLLGARAGSASLPVASRSLPSERPQGRAQSGAGVLAGPQAPLLGHTKAPGRRACLGAASELVFLCPAAEPKCWSVRSWV